ncbi:MAG: hypothetical protein RJA70_2267 [Pseudomonadota bacterium]|jgi:uncharacterized membrane protein
MSDALARVHWVWLAAGTLQLALLTLGAVLLARQRQRWALRLGFCFAFAPLLYATGVWAGLYPEHYVRFVRPWAAPIPTFAVLFVTARLLWSHAAASPARVRLRDALLLGAAGSLGLGVAGIELGTPLDRLAILVAVDQSRSVDLVNDTSTRITRELQLAELSMRPDDKLGVLVFGSSARLETPLRRRDERPTPQTASIGRDATDLEQALRRALLELPSDARGKIVLLSDGVATRGDTLGGVAAAVAAEVPIDTVALDQRRIQNVRLVNLSGPTSVSEGETFDLRAVIEAPTEQELELRILADGEVIRTGNVRVREGSDVLNLRQIAQSSGLRRYEVQLSAKNPALDGLTEDNQRAAFVKVRGPTNTLILSADPSDARALEAALSDAQIQVTSSGLVATPSGVAELAAYDLVVLRDLPAHVFTPEQLDAFGAHVRAMGGGLLLMGSDKSLGPGGYGKTAIEDVSPVSFDLKQDRRRGRLAQVIAIDYSGSMAASAGKLTKLDLANDAACRSIELLSPGDRIAVMHVDTAVSWTLPFSEIVDKAKLQEKVRGVGSGGGGILVDLSLRAAYAALAAEKTNLKHVLLFADGSDAEQRDEAPNLVRAALAQGITTSVVALGQGSDVGALEVMSRLGNGRFYLIEDAQRLPAVFAQETILAARSALYETPFTPEPRATTGALRGVDFSQMPPLDGYVITIPKARTQVLLSGPEGDPILASWSVGVGRAGAFTSDYATGWGKAWANWPGASQLFAQLGRSLARASDDAQVRLQAVTRAGNLEVSADIAGGFRDSYRRFEVNIAGPSGEVQRLPLSPSGPGRYSGRLPLERPGAYVASLVDLESGGVVGTAGAELHPSDELKPTGTDRGTLAQIARESGGQVRDTLAGLFHDRLGPRFSYRDISAQLLWIGAWLLLLSVAARRLSLPEPLLSLGAQLWRIRFGQPRSVPGSTHLSTPAALSVLAARQTRAPSDPLRVPSFSGAQSVPPPRRASRPPSGPALSPQTLSPESTTAASPVVPSVTKLTAAQVLLERRRKSRR